MMYNRPLISLSLALVAGAPTALRSQDSTGTRIPSMQDTVRGPSPLARLDSLFTRSDSRARELQVEIGHLRARLDTVDRRATLTERATLEDLRKSLRASNERIETLERLGKAQFTGAVDEQSLRYEAGKEIYVILIGNTEKLRVTLDLTNSITQFANLANPMQSLEFSNQIGFLLHPDRVPSDARLQPPSGFLANPYVSAAISMASVIAGRMNRGDRESRFAKIACVVDFTSRASGDIRQVQGRLDELSRRLLNFESDGVAGFERFSEAVGFRRSWKDYKRDRATLPADPLTARVKQHFDSIKSSNRGQEATADRIATLQSTRYQLEQLKATVVEYERVLSEAEAFLVSYQATLDRYDAVACASIPGVDVNMKRLGTEAATLRDRFHSAFFQDVPARSKALLYGT